MLVQNVFTSTLINKKAAGRGMSTKVKKEAKHVCVTTCILNRAGPSQNQMVTQHRFTKTVVKCLTQHFFTLNRFFLKLRLLET